MTFPLPNNNPVWPHFQTLCRIPRPSKHEAALRDHLRAWAEARGLATVLDTAGNLLIKKPASAGMEGRQTVVLQSHLDMVTQKNDDTPHDFFTDPIVPHSEAGWLVAANTTLGADNGIGVALALAVLEATDLAHPPIEALFTVDEEAGMGGAQGLAPDLLSGQLLINMDTEGWGEFYLGCAGGVDVNIHHSYRQEQLPAGYSTVQLTVSGLRGGHSGVDIHEERGNAIKLLIALLRELEGQIDVRLAKLAGGTARNALAREAHALIALPSAAAVQLDRALSQWLAATRQALLGVDEHVSVKASPAQFSQVMLRADQAALLGALHAAPHGVKRMSQRVPGVVETSNNLGVIALGDGQCHANFMVRSLTETGAQGLAAEIASLFGLIGAQVEREGAYPGWTPNPDSALLALFQTVYAQEFGGHAKVMVIHAGLECGIISAKYPQMDMVSFGPNIRGAHAPGERVEIATVDHAWLLLQAVLAQIPRA